MPEALAWSAYSDPELTARERERIFARAWQYVGHLGELGDAAGYLAARVGDIPIVVTRDREGQLRAFLNVCRHRGSVLATGTAARETLQCPYHAWTYRLDGTLKAAPRSDRELGFDCEGISLRPASVGAWVRFYSPTRTPKLCCSPTSWRACLSLSRTPASTSTSYGTTVGPSRRSRRTGSS